MKPTNLLVKCAVWFTVLTVSPHVSIAKAQGTAFTYQAQLSAGGVPISGIYDLTFALYDDPAAGSQIGNSLTNTAVPVTNGLFTVSLDFGGVFDGNPRWLDIGVETNGGGSFTTLSPRQPLTPTPYAIAANAITGSMPATQLLGPLSSDQLNGDYTNALVFDNPGNSFTGDGTGLFNLNADTLDGLTTDSFWQTGGNIAAPGANFLGTINNEPLELRVNNTRALRLEPNIAGAPNIIGGSLTNSVDQGILGAFIGGGGATNYLGFIYVNRISADFGSIAGGADNSILTGAVFGTIGGGIENRVGSGSATISGGYGNFINNFGTYSAIGGGSGNQIFSQYCVVSGGLDNAIVNGAGNSVIAGGQFNFIENNSSLCTIGGGDGHFIMTNSPWSVIAGGRGNVVRGNSNGSSIGGGASNTVFNYYATVPGGYSNAATGFESFAAGAFASASHSNSFVWGDANGNAVSTGPGQFVVQAFGGMQLVNSTALTVSGPETFGGPATFNSPSTSQFQLQLTQDSAAKPNGGTWSNTSDARIKKNIRPLAGALDKLVQLRGVDFQWINPEDHANQTNTQCGFIAQEVERVFPDWVTLVAAGEHDKNLTSDARVRSLSLPFAYDALVVEALKELRAEKDANIAELRVRNQMLEQQLSAQRTASARTEARLADLERTIIRLSEKLDGSFAAAPEPK